jgi:Protein of unknown function (DUF1570)
MLGRHRSSYLLLAVICVFTTGLLNAGPPVLEIQMKDSVERGVPVFWGEDRSILLHPDGQITSIPRANMESFRLTEAAFVPATVASMRGVLQKEFGRAYKVVAAGNYVVVAQGNSAEEWIRRFAELESAFFRFFSTRGFPLINPEFPLVAIVLPDQDTFMVYAKNANMEVNVHTLGLYSPMTNRMVLFEQSSSDAISTLSTIQHESTHQLAFNCGVHQRLSDIPIWTAEGLASVFEPPAMLEAAERSQVARRFNPVRFATWQQMANQPEKVVALLKNLIVSDNAFDINPDQAYALAWALSFYLAERDSDRYVNYMSHIAKRQAGVAYSASSRRRDFEKYIGSDHLMLINNMRRFFEENAP